MYSQYNILVFCSSDILLLPFSSAKIKTVLRFNEWTFSSYSSHSTEFISNITTSSFVKIYRKYQKKKKTTKETVDSWLYANDVQQKEDNMKLCWHWHITRKWNSRRVNSKYAFWQFHLFHFIIYFFLFAWCCCVPVYSYWFSVEIWADFIILEIEQNNIKMHIYTLNILNEWNERKKDIERKLDELSQKRKKNVYKYAQTIENCSNNWIRWKVH